MAKINFVKKARKGYPEKGINPGDSYYWWQTYGQPAQVSKTIPRPSQLTGSSKKAAALAAGEAIEDAIAAFDVSGDYEDSITEVLNVVSDSVDAIREVAEEYRESAENIRASFSESATADDCDAAADELETWADTLESDASELESIKAAGPDAYASVEAFMTALQDEMASWDLSAPV